MATDDNNTLVYRLSVTAVIPTRAHEGDAGWDLYSDEERMEIAPRSRRRVATGLVVKIPEGHYGRVASRSGLSIAGVYADGVIDSNYRGELFVCLRNESDVAVVVERRTRVAQLIVEKISTEPLIEVFDIAKLGDTDRGTNGFGSSGIWV